MQRTTERIDVVRQDGEDPSTAAARAAQDAGTKVATNLRLYGPGTTPAGDHALYLAITTEDGREIRVWERERDLCGGCGRRVEIDSLEPVLDEAAGTVSLLCPDCRD